MSPRMSHQYIHDSCVQVARIGKMAAAYQSYSLTVLAIIMTHMMHAALSGPWAPAVHCTKGVQLSVLLVCMAYTMHMPVVPRAS